MDLNQIAIKGTTQEHLPVEDVQDNLIILKDGSCVMILQISSVNFDLLSEKEQEAMIYAYAGLLNSLTFSIQIIVRSTLKDVSSYVNRLKQQEAKTNDPLLQKQIVSYRQFVEEVVEKNNVLAKSFYVAIPFSAVELGLQSAAGTSFRSTLSVFSPQKGNKRLPLAKDRILEKAKASLEPKKEHLLRLLGRLGLVAKQLNDQELIRLFYQIYNQESIPVTHLEGLGQKGPIVRSRLKNGQNKRDLEKDQAKSKEEKSD